MQCIVCGNEMKRRPEFDTEEFRSFKCVSVDETGKTCTGAGAEAKVSVSELFPEYQFSTPEEMAAYNKAMLSKYHTGEKKWGTVEWVRNQPYWKGKRCK